MIPTGRAYSPGRSLTRAEVSGRMLPVESDRVVLGAKRGAGETRRMVLLLAREGRGLREIARLLDISTQGVHWHLKRLRADGELPEEEAV